MAFNQKRKPPNAPTSAPHSPLLLTSPPQLLHFNSHLPRLHFCMHFYYERPKTRCDAQQTKRISQTKRMRRRCSRAWSAIATTPPLSPPTLLPHRSACLRPQERSRLWSVLNEVAASRCLAALQTQIKKHFLFFSAIRKYENSFCRRRRRRWGRATMASATTYGLTTWTNCSMWRRRHRINEIEADEKLFQPKCIKML